MLPLLHERHQLLVGLPGGHPGFKLNVGCQRTFRVMQGPFGADSDLRRWGQKLSARGGKNAKKRAVVAVARKLAVLLHRLWVSGEVYEPLRNSRKAMKAAA